MLNTLIGKFGGFAGGSSSEYLGTKRIDANVAITFPNNIGFAVVKMFGGKGNSGQGGFTVIKLGSSSAGQTYYVTTDGNDSPGGTWINNPDSLSPVSSPPSIGHKNPLRGGGYVSFSTATMGPSGGPSPVKAATVLGLAGGGGSRQPQSGDTGGNAGYPGGGNGGIYNPGVPGGIGGDSATPIGGWPVGSPLFGAVGNYSPAPNAGSGGGGGAGYVGGGSGTATPQGGGRGGSGGGGSNYYVPSSNPHLSSVANNVYSRFEGYDTTDPDYDAGDAPFGDSTLPTGAPDPESAIPDYHPLSNTRATSGTNYPGPWGSAGYAVIKFFSGEELDYDSSNYPSSQPTAPNGF